MGEHVSGFELMGMVGEIGGDLADDGSSDSDSDSGRREKFGLCTKLIPVPPELANSLIASRKRLSRSK